LSDNRKRIHVLNSSFSAENPTVNFPDSENIGCLSTLVSLVAYVCFVLTHPELHSANKELTAWGFAALFCSIPLALMTSAAAQFILKKWDIYRALRILPPWWPVRTPWHQPSLAYSQPPIEAPDIPPDEKLSVSDPKTIVDASEAADQQQPRYPSRASSHTQRRMDITTDPHERMVILADGFRITPAEDMHLLKRWTTRWSDGGNIPLGLALPKDHYFAKSNLHFYPKGLWVFSANRIGIQVEEWDERHAGLSVEAVTAKHAVYLLHKHVGALPHQFPDSQNEPPREDDRKS
jgi:hypothetical protein